MTAVGYFERIEAARTPADLFEDADKARATYRRLARTVHPDVNPDDKTRAETAFARLSELWNEYNGTSPSVSAPSGRLVYETKRSVYVVDALVGRGDIANIYTVQYVSGSEHMTAALKMPRSPVHSDMIVNEIQALKDLKDGVDEQWQMFHPTTVDSFSHRASDTGKTRRAVITKYLDGYVSLRDVRTAYPKGIDPRHVAWIGRRLWVALDTAHFAGRIHGAVFPEHVMIHPENHELVLIDWCYSKTKGGKLDYAVPQYLKDGWYGKAHDKPLDHRLDVRQASHTLDALLGGQEARPFRAFFNGCRVASTPTAGELYEEFEELLKRLYGKRTFVPFAMPQGWKKEV